MAADGVSGAKNQPQFLASGAPAIDVDPGIVADYAAKVGNRRVGTTAERNAATGKDVWEGLEWWDTSLSRRFVHKSGVWDSGRIDTAVVLTAGWVNQVYTLQTSRSGGVVVLSGRVARTSGTATVIGTVGAADAPQSNTPVVISSLNPGNVIGPTFYILVGSDGQVSVTNLGDVAWGTGTYLSINASWAI